MRTEFWHICQGLRKFFGDDARLQRSQTNTADTVHLMYLTDQAEQRFLPALFKIHAIGA